MNVEIGTEAAQFPEKEYINGIFVVVRVTKSNTEEAFPHCMNPFLISPKKGKCVPEYFLSGALL